MNPIIVPEKYIAYVKPNGSWGKRPIREQSYMIHAVEMAKQATCDRLQVGAVFTDRAMKRILCSGYNGSYAGGPNGCDSTEVSLCGCIHGEVNALTQSRDDLNGSVCFVTTFCCVNCAKIVVNRGVSRVVYLENYRNNDGLKILQAADIEIVKYSDLPG